MHTNLQFYAIAIYHYQFIPHMPGDLQAKVIKKYNKIKKILKAGIGGKKMTIM